MENFAKETLPISLEEEMRRSYLDYAMSVIVGRALPDVRDGLKPVHRRALFSMHELNNDWNKPHKKSSRIVGDVIAKYHPHGDVAVYDAIVRMAQPFSLRYMLVDGQGNFGSVDGDSPAAMRYTEIRISKVCNELLADLDQETVNFELNYDGAEQMPTVLPAKLPNLLVNGSSGIAVGMATNIPPHNLSEVVDACRHLLKNPNASVDDLMTYLPAPDFPTGGKIYGLSGVKDGYRTGRGRVVMRAKTHFEEIDKNGRQAIVVDEIPYQVNKSVLLKRMAEQVADSKLEGISDIRDESDRNGMRIVIELKRGEIAEVVLNNLFKFTQLQDTFGLNFVALVDGQPQLLNLQQMIMYYLAHRREVITRKTLFQIKKARERAIYLQGLAVALENIDQFIEIIKNSPNPSAASKALCQKSWPAVNIRALMAKITGTSDINILDLAASGVGVGKFDETGNYFLSENQALAILQMRLQRLTGFEKEKILGEFSELVEKIKDLADILAKPSRVLELIDDELQNLKNQFGDSRRSQIELDAQEISIEDLITPEECVVTLSSSGYIKSQRLSEYRAQKRGGRGRQATVMKGDDWIETLFTANKHDVILCFSDKGRVYSLKVYQIPSGSRNSRGRPIVNFFPLAEDEKINVILPVKEFDDAHFVFMATSRGTVKKTPLSLFARVKSKGIVAVNLDEGDFLVGAEITNGLCEIMLFSDTGKAVRFSEADTRPMGREARGVRGMRVDDNQSVIALLVAAFDENSSVLTVTENGYGKRTPIAEYTRHRRGQKGMIAIQSSKRNGRVVAATLVKPENEIMLVTNAGVVIRTRVSEIREMGRVTQGVTLINLDKGTQLSGCQRVAETEDLIDDSTH